MKKLFIYTSFSAIVMLLAVSCTKNLTGLNQDVKKPSEVSATALFVSSTKELADAVTSTNVNLDIFRLLVQHWTQTTYRDESNYDLISRTIPDEFWDAVYTDALKDLKSSKAYLLQDNITDPDITTNRLAQVEIMSVYATSVVVNTFGDVPYTESLSYDTLFPKYDDARGIYTDLVKRLDAAVASFKPDADGFGTSNMLFATDEIAGWTKFAKSLKLRLGILLADVDPGAAQEIILEAAPKSFNTQGEYARFPYSTVPPNTNPLWEDLVQSGRQDFVGANTLVDIMNELQDPRRKFYFTTIGGNYVGGNYGYSNPYANYSHPGTLLEKKDLPGVFIDYSEVEFMRAEAIERGIAVGGSAEEHYNNAITNSFLFWGNTAADAQAYLANPEVNYASAPGTWRQKIGLQAWIALYNRGFDAWTDLRHFDFPAMKVPPRAVSGFPNRYSYPISEQNLNTKNYDDAVSKIGGTDAVEKKLFWDIY